MSHSIQNCLDSFGPNIINFCFHVFLPGDCTNCSSKHGKCVKGFCECEDGWQGVTCEEQGQSRGIGVHNEFT